MNLRKYWIEYLTFGIILTLLLVDLNPDYTFINKSADSIGYGFSAKYLYPSYHTSSPFYLLLSHVFLWIPLGTDAWRMGLISVVSTVVACVFIYLIIKRKTKARFYSIFGVIIYGASALVISQSIIVNTYALITCFVIISYYFAILKKWKIMSLFVGLGMAVHLLGFVILVLYLIFFKDYRKNWKALVITFSFILFYLYIPITTRPPYMWMPNPKDINTIQAVISDTISVIAMLVGTISVFDLPKKILDTIGVMWVSIGIVTIIPIVYYFIKQGKKTLINPLFWFIIAPITLFISELDMNTFDYMMLSIPFLAIVAALGLRLLIVKYRNPMMIASVVGIFIVIGIGGFNYNYFDIGRTLDPNLSASQLYYKELPKIPDGAVFMPNGGWNWEAVYKYNKDNNTNIYPICIDILPSKTYQEQLMRDGIKLVSSNNENVSMQASEMAKSIVSLNDNIWTTISTDPSTFGVMVIETKHNTDLINSVDVNILKQNATSPKIRWMPDNPYDIMTTSIFITKWSYVLVSRYNFMVFTVIFLSVYLIMIYTPRMFKRGHNANTVYKEEIKDRK